MKTVWLNRHKIYQRVLAPSFFCSIIISTTIVTATELAIDAKSQQYQRAADDCTIVIKRNPADGLAYYTRGGAYKKLGQYQILCLFDFVKSSKS